MSDHKKIISKLTNSDFEQIFDNIFGNIFITDDKGIVLYVNENAAKNFGIPKDKLISMSSHDLISKNLLSRSFALEAIEKKAPVIGYNSVEFNNHLQLSSIATPLFDENGNLKMVVVYSQNFNLAEEFLNAVYKDREKLESYKNVLDYMQDFSAAGKTIVVKSNVMKKIFKYIDAVTESDSTVIIYGESGTGKDVIANYVHKNSPKRSKPFIPVNCAAIPRELMESEFFGYVKGAFTGANKDGKIGFFELANDATLFLDEIGELPLDLQTKLLRVLETGEYCKIGSADIVKSNFRLLAATNRDLKQMVKDKLFREDLYYRLNIVPVYLPPLRDRKEEIESLANVFLSEFNKKYNTQKVFSDEILDFFNEYEWPGNIRELKNFVERLVITSKDIVMTLELLNYSYNINTTNSVVKEPKPIPKKEIISKNLSKRLKNAQLDKVIGALIKCNGNKTKAAEMLGISKGKLYKILRDDD